MKKKFRWMAAMLAVIIAISQFGAAAPMTAHAAFEETMSEDLEEVLTQEDAEEPEVVTKGWYQVEDDWYYNDAEGNQVFDWQEIDGFWYYFDKNNAEKPGVMLSNCKRVIRGCTYFFNGSGQMQTGWIQRAEGWYYTNDQGAMITGWKFIGNFWYYLDGKNFKTPGLMLRDCKKILDGKTYIFNGSGQMKRGWAKRPEGWYYTADSGEIITGWKFVDAQWYYLDGSNLAHPGLMVSDCKKVIDNNTYHFNANGEMLRGWYSENGAWYYLDGSGLPATGWRFQGMHGTI